MPENISEYIINKIKGFHFLKLRAVFNIKFEFAKITNKADKLQT